MVAELLSIDTETISDETPDASYLYQDDLGFENRRKAYEAGEFGFVGIRAVATINVAGTIQTISSPGLWGIEDDSGDDYFREIEKEELAQLDAILLELGIANKL